jgi:hypothetical protein
VKEFSLLIISFIEIDGVWEKVHILHILRFLLTLLQARHTVHRPLSTLVPLHNFEFRNLGLPRVLHHNVLG